MVEYCNTGKQAVRDECLQKMLEIKSQKLNSDVDRDQLSYLSEWYHPVILELVGLPEFQNDITWIADQIVPRIRPELIKKSLQLLLKLSLLKSMVIPIDLQISVLKQVTASGVSL